MSWSEEREAKLRELWEKGHTASQIAEILGGTTRNAVIGKAHRLNLAARASSKRPEKQKTKFLEDQNKQQGYTSRKERFKSLLLDKNFEPAKNLNLEELTENTCKYMEGHPNEETASFCGRKTVEKFSYCPLHLMIVFQPKGKKDEVIDKEEEVPKFIEKKIKSAS
mgnify:CR=1 FL=1